MLGTSTTHSLGLCEEKYIGGVSEGPLESKYGTDSVKVSPSYMLYRNHREIRKTGSRRPLTVLTILLIKRTVYGTQINLKKT